MADEPDHGDIMRALGRIEGRLIGIDNRISDHEREIDDIHRTVTTVRVDAAAHAARQGGRRGAATGAGSGGVIAVLVQAAYHLITRGG